MSYEYIDLTENPNRVNCSLCKVSLSRNDRNISTHNLGNNHMKLKAADYASHNAITKVENDDEKMWCKLCKVEFDYIFYDDIFNHIEDAEHVSLFEDIVELIDGEDINIDAFRGSSYLQDKAYCGLCEVWIPCNFHNLKEHIDGNNHLHLKAEDTMKLHGIFHVENDNDSLWCKICKVSLEYNTHADLYSHVYNDQYHCDWFEEITELIDGEDVSIDDYCTSLTQSKAYCDRCDVWIPCSENCIGQHVNGNRHNQ